MVAIPRLRIHAARALALGAALFVAPGIGWCQADFPSRPVRLLIPIPTGGAADKFGRTSVDRLFTEINRALGDPDLKKRQNASGIEPVGSPSQQHFAAFVQSEHERWGRIIRESGIRVE